MKNEKKLLHYFTQIFDIHFTLFYSSTFIKKKKFFLFFIRKIIISILNLKHLK